VGLLPSHGVTNNAFPLDCTNGYFELPFYGKVGNDEWVTNLGFIGEFLNYELMSGFSNPETGGLRL
jgi:hypothetical protein